MALRGHAPYFYQTNLNQEVEQDGKEEEVSAFSEPCGKEGMAHAEAQVRQRRSEIMPGRKARARRKSTRKKDKRKKKADSRSAFDKLTDGVHFR